MKTTTLRSDEITCGGCANAIQKSFTEFPGVAKVTVDVDAKAVTFEHEETVSPETLADRLDKAGFTVTGDKAQGSPTAASFHL
jgi:copper chaperone